MYLNTHSYFSLRYGVMDIDKLLETAAYNGVETMALTDINTTMGIPEFVKKAVNIGIKPIAGVEVRNGNELSFIGLAKNNMGFKELNDYLTQHNLNKKRYTSGLWQFDNVIVIYPPGSKRVTELKENEFIGIKRSFINRLCTSEYYHRLDKLVIWQPVTFYNREGWFLHKSLRAIDNNTLISKLQSGQVASPDEIMTPVTTLMDVFKKYPEILTNTKKIMEECSIDFDFKTIKNRKHFSLSAYDDKLLLEKLTLDGLEYRYGKDDTAARNRVQHELQIIDKLGFSAYFLITWDIIRYSMSRGFYHVGRGSGANSIVAYCLRITDVDPIKLNLYFERFLNPKRSSPPDFDIDYSWRDRNQVLDYIFKRYGSNHTALLGATSTFRSRSIIRELGKVFGLPGEEIDLLVHDPENIENKHHIAETITTLGRQLSNFPNMRTIHTGGVLISESPITCYTALDLPPKGFPVTHWDMYVAEEMGFEKLDILSQRGIGHIRDAVDIIYENRNEKIDIHCVNKFFEDKKVQQQLRTGETNGCFYIESPAMRGLLKKLKCSDYATLVAASSIIRPGVAKSGMMKEYIHRFHHPHNFQYIHPVMKEQLSETFGIMVFQEDVIKVAHHFAGLDPADADVLRRAMSGKYRSTREFKRIEQKYFENCHIRGYPDNISREVWRQIESFAGYSFSKAHSASYAVESFQSLFLKAHYPLEFQVAVINNHGGFYPTWVYINEARRQGATIESHCINHSKRETSINKKTIWPGFELIKGLEDNTIDTIINERNNNGQFESLSDFIQRVPIGREQLILLIRAKAFCFASTCKATLLWEAHILLSNRGKSTSEGTLFQVASKKFQLPPFKHEKIRDAYDEIELFGFPISTDTFDLLKTSFRGEVMANELIRHVGEKVRMVGRLVTVKYVRTVKKEIMVFGTFIDVKGEFFDTVHFPTSLRDFPFRGDGIYLLLGKIVEEFDFPSLEVEKMAKLPYNLPL